MITSVMFIYVIVQFRLTFTWQISWIHCPFPPHHTKYSSKHQRLTTVPIYIPTSVDLTQHFIYCHMENG